ncbi:hypothetical protein LTR65_008275 [Meristemomyces frigidus]
MSAQRTATAEVFGIGELIDNILAYLPARSLFRFLRVNKRLQKSIEQSLQLQDTLSFGPGMLSGADDKGNSPVHGGWGYNPLLYPPMTGPVIITTANGTWAIRGQSTEYRRLRNDTGALRRALQLRLITKMPPPLSAAHTVCGIGELFDAICVNLAAEGLVPLLRASKAFAQFVNQSGPLQETLRFGHAAVLTPIPIHDFLPPPRGINPLLRKLPGESGAVNYIKTTHGAWRLSSIVLFYERPASQTRPVVSPDVRLCISFRTAAQLAATQSWYTKHDIETLPGWLLERSDFLDSQYICQPSRAITISAHPSERRGPPEVNVKVEAGSTFGDVLDAVEIKAVVEGWKAAS